MFDSHNPKCTMLHGQSASTLSRGARADSFVVEVKTEKTAYTQAHSEKKVRSAYHESSVLCSVTCVICKSMNCLLSISFGVFTSTYSAYNMAESFSRSGFYEF